ncbi:MAG: tetratricopeptide repeat protein [Oligoflexia bacterium]|nr:tetratricopeptide repeat protein [Oligoflexia bacterium]
MQSLALLLILAAACGTQDTDPAPAKALPPPAPAPTPASAPASPPSAKTPAAEPPAAEPPWLPDEHRIIDPQIQYAKGMIDDKQVDQAVVLLDAYIGATPNDPDAYYWRGKAHQKQGDLKAAEADYRQANTLSQTWLGARQSLADLLVNTQRCPDAVPLLQQQVDALPKLGQAWANLGFCKMRADDPNGGLADLRKGCDLGYANACESVARAESRGAPPASP